MGTYTPEWQRRKGGGARRSADRVVPLLMETFNPSSVVDLGCGTGAWLASFADHGVTDVMGIDGDWVDRDALLIAPQCFLAADLTAPLELPGRFDLALSLEVGEHLPESAAHIFVASLVSLAPVVVFSAAIPGQAGTHHVNCQWQDYWAGIFRGHGYVPVDLVRPKVWNDPMVRWFYKQNTLVYVRDPSMWGLRDAELLDVVHPRMLSLAEPRSWRDLSRAAWRLLTSGSHFR